MSLPTFFSSLAAATGLRPWSGRVHRFALASLCALTLGDSTLAHTPVCQCKRIQNQIHCEGAYHDGQPAVGVTMVVIAYNGEALESGELDTDSRFQFAMPRLPFYVLMDAGPGEISEVDWRDIAGIPGNHFPAEMSALPNNEGT